MSGPAGLSLAIRYACPRLTGAEVLAWVDCLAPQMRSADITSPNRVAAFVGQWAHESSGFVSLSENLNYSAERIPQVWPRLAGRAHELARNPEALANAAYGGRMGNGPEPSGDGWRFRGGGLPQLTGRDNYVAFTRAHPGLTADEAAEWVRKPAGAGAAAVWFWTKIGGNALADAWAIDDLTRRINGGLNGAAQRRILCNAALAAITKVAA